VTLPNPHLRQSTGVLEVGAAVGDDARGAFSALVLKHAGDAPFVTLIGSLLPDFPPDCYAQLIQALKARSARVTLDTSGAALRCGALAGPAILKVNMEEFASAFELGRAPSWNTILDVLGDLRERGLELLALTDGERGAYLFARDGEALHVTTPLDRWVCPAGSGDAFMAALLLALGHDCSVEEAAVIASAAAAANVAHLVSGSIDADVFARLKPRTVIEPLREESWR
jgi:fructose-1-phosphate kinase PfkB-like protein